MFVRTIAPRFPLNVAELPLACFGRIEWKEISRTYSEHTIHQPPILVEGLYIFSKSWREILHSIVVIVLRFDSIYKNPPVCLYRN